jgi:hypothetical protein
MKKKPTPIQTKLQKILDKEIFKVRTSVLIYYYYREFICLIREENSINYLERISTIAIFQKKKGCFKHPFFATKLNFYCGILDRVSDITPEVMTITAESTPQFVVPAHVIDPELPLKLLGVIVTPKV